MSTEDSQPIDAKPAAGKAPQLEDYFLKMVQYNASDLHLKSDWAPLLRINTTIRMIRREPLPAAEVKAMVRELLTDNQLAYLEEHGSIDLAYELPDSDRFRINIYRSRGTLSLAVRRVTRNIPAFEKLHLPPVLHKIAEEHQGLVLLSGPTGSGKSTTIAAMIEHINRSRPCHIVTIEDPIEYLYTDKKAVIHQREVGIDVENFEAALKYLMRQDPDVVLIGEMRDRETFQAALQASETGHLVLGTVHASTASQTIGRILDLFPGDHRDMIRQSLSFNLRAIVCQKLLPCLSKDISRVPAVEVMLTNPSVRQLIQEKRDTELPDIIRAHERDGMQSFTRSLLDLIQNDLIDPKVGYDAAPNVEELKMQLKGISASRTGFLGR